MPQWLCPSVNLLVAPSQSLRRAPRRTPQIHRRGNRRAVPLVVRPICPAAAPHRSPLDCRRMLRRVSAAVPHLRFPVVPPLPLRRLCLVLTRRVCRLTSPAHSRPLRRQVVRMLLPVALRLGRRQVSHRGLLPGSRHECPPLNLPASRPVAPQVSLRQLRALLQLPRPHRHRHWFRTEDILCLPICLMYMEPAGQIWDCLCLLAP